MNYIPENKILTTNGDWAANKAFHPGLPISIELSGTFAGAAVTLGFASNDDPSVFIADIGDDGLPVVLTESQRWNSFRPASGRPAVQIAAATGSTAIRVEIVDLMIR